MMNSRPNITYRPTIATKLNKDFKMPESKATVSRYPGISNRALILMLIATANKTVEMTNCLFYHARIAIRQKIIMKQSLNCLVTPTNLYLAYKKRRQKTNMFLLF